MDLIEENDPALDFDIDDLNEIRKYADIPPSKSQWPGMDSKTHWPESECKNISEFLN
jgi:hypothetical protein